MKRRANIEEPKSIYEARTRLVDAKLEIEKINEELTTRFRFRDEDGLPMSPVEHLEWRKRASGAKGWFMSEAAICQQWIDGYEKDIRTEEETALREKTINTQRKNAKDKLARAEELRKRDAENNAWRIKMVKEFGTTRLPPDVARAQTLEIERLRLEAKQAELARLDTSHRRQEQKARHREWLRQLEIDDPVNELDPVNLLARAYRVLHRLAKEGKFDYASEAGALLSIIQERQLILNHIENDGD